MTVVPPSTPAIHVDRRRRGRTAKRLWKWMKRRAAVELGIGHSKSEHRLDRNRLWGEHGDMINVILSAAAMNFRKLLHHAAAFLRLSCGRLPAVARQVGLLRFPRSLLCYPVAA